MKDSFFSSKRYQGLYEPVYRFKEFGDLENYWIRLRYLCNRDDWQAVRGARGAPLDFDMLNEDGQKIFGDIPEAHLAILRNRGYVLGGSSEPEPVDEEGSVVSVSETYVYAPDKTYSVYDTDIVPIWGLKDTDYQTQSSVVIGEGAGNVRQTQFYLNTIIHVQNAAEFKTGDYVILHFTCTLTHVDGASRWDFDDAWTESTPQRIVRIDGNFVELQGNAAFTTFDDKYTTIPNHHIHDVSWFFDVLNGGSLPSDYNFTMSPTSGYMLRAYSTRTMKKRGLVMCEEVAFHRSFPDISNSEIFVPQQETGTEYNDISRETAIIPAQWKAKVATGEWFIYSEPKVAYGADHGIYELRVKKSHCK